MNAYDKIRYALTEAKGWLLECLNEDNPPTKDGLNEAIDRIDAALALPSRNCDVGTEEEQRRRFNMFCRKTGERFGESAYCAYSCPCGESVDCKLEWAQMPYTEEEGGAECQERP